MKSLLIILITLLSLSLNAQDSTKKVKTNTSTVVKDTTIKGNTYTIYKSVHDKLYIVRTSGKTGNQYKQYLK